MNWSVLWNATLNNHSEKYLDVNSVIDNHKIASLPTCTFQDIDQTIQKAHQVFIDWKNTPWFERKRIILEFRDRLNQAKEMIADILVQEIAKTKIQSIQEINRSIEYIDLTILEYEKSFLNPEKYDLKQLKKYAEFSYEPLGVVLAISPFNYPINLLITKIIPALVVGNCVVYKPAKQGSVSGVIISNLLYESGLCNGEVSCVIGNGNEIGDYLVNHQGINMISFTGSTKVGNNIIKKRHDIPIVLEMGGKDPAIVLNDADLDLTAKEIVNGAFGFNGQRCTAIKRVLVQKETHDALVNKIIELTQKLIIDTANNQNAFITEMIDSKAVEYNIELINDALQHDAKLNLDYKNKNNKILNPVILTNVSVDCRIAFEEQFGPVLPIILVKDINEAIKISNQSEYGLQASIFSNNIQLAKKLATELQVGTVNINRSSSRGPDVFPFLGVKQSGFGIQGVKQALQSMTIIKGIVIND